MLPNSLNSFESSTDYYLVMEYIESQVTLQEFCHKAHEYIQRGILDRKEWNKILKFISWQLVATIYYMHNSLNIAHLDLTMVCRNSIHRPTI